MNFAPGTVFMIRHDMGNGKVEDFKYKVGKNQYGAIIATLIGNGGVMEKSGGGFIAGSGTSTSDSIMAMLSNGEYVTKAASVAKYGVSFMNSINNGTYTPSIPNMAGVTQMIASETAGGSVYNITVNAETNANADDIANTVLATIERRNKMTSTNRRISV
jgi:hypothetical protein